MCACVLCACVGLNTNANTCPPLPSPPSYRALWLRSSATLGLNTNDTTGAQAGHKLMKIVIQPGQEIEMVTMIIECCSQVWGGKGRGGRRRVHSGRATTGQGAHSFCMGHGASAWPHACRAACGSKRMDQMQA